MDNSQFRHMLQHDQAGKPLHAGAAPATAKPAALGSKSRSSIPMTPRSVAAHNTSKDAARHVAGYGRDRDGQPLAKKFKSSAAPKGTKLAAGYQDRTQLRRAGDDDESEPADDKGQRLKALEEMYKLQQIDAATFERLKEQLGVGGTLENTHLVKGLDWKLLRRIRQGEDITTTAADDSTETGAKVDVDDELDQLLDKDVPAAPSGRRDNDNTTAPPEEGQPRTRDDILRQLKESRRAAREAAAPPALGERFKKVGTDPASHKTRFVEEVNGRRREVLVVTHQDGTTKRKTRWIDPEGTVSVPPARQQPLGMEVPAELQAKQQALLAQEAADADADDDDIFQGVAAYDPLAGIECDSSSSESDHGDVQPNTAVTAEKTADDTRGRPRNYFAHENHDHDHEHEETDRVNPIMKDPTIMAALKRAANLRRAGGDDGEDGEGEVTDDADPDRAEKHRQFLARLKAQDRADVADLDMGFSDSRFGDDDDDGAAWADETEGPKKAQRKRGPKKRKGDKDSINDVMAVFEGRTKKKG